MWLLRNDQKGLIYRVSSGKQHIVSRKDGDLLLLGDQSISRKHAQLFIDDENESEGVILKDLDSKYGTFTVIGDAELTQLPANETVTLKCGDSIRFGIQWNIWRVDFVPLLVATSTLTQDEKTEVKQLVTALGGQVVSNWQDKCTHLTMNQLTVTVKVVCALASCQPIVMPTFWKSFTQALSAMETTLPDCNNFVPPLAEAVLNPSEVSFSPNPARSKLFNGYTFVASSIKQLSRIKSMVTAAGGTAVEFSARTWTEDKLMKDNIILMLQSTNDKPGSQSSQVADGYIVVARKLKAQGVRCIPESEIGLGVLYCSMEQYCNPRYSPRSILGFSSSLEATQPITAISSNSEESTNSLENENEVNTVPRSPTSTSSKKRPHEDLSEDEGQASKKADTRAESEDLFGSQVVNNNNNHKSTSSNRSHPITNKAPPSEILSSSSKPKQPVVNPDPSLDMFAPSGSRSSGSHHQDNVPPSCEDLFGSAGSRRTRSRIQNDNDEFSFTSKKSRQQNAANEVDEFSFTAKKKSVKPKDEVNEICVDTNEKLKPKERVVDENDDFSFTSVKNSTKRNRESDLDMFASSNESLIKNHSIAGPSKIRKTNDEDEFCFREKRKSSSKDNLFLFPAKPGRKYHNEGLLGANETDCDIKIALFSKQDASTAGPSRLLAAEETTENEIPSEKKDLVTYSKLLPAPASVKKEIDDLEVDELAKELHNATIVIVKPLVVARQKPAEALIASGKNFKKFRKVVGLNKRAVPHIIGGSDLVPHNGDCELLNDLLPKPPSPHHLTPDDEWGFHTNKKRGKAR